MLLSYGTVASAKTTGSTLFVLTQNLCFKPEKIYENVFKNIEK